MTYKGTKSRFSSSDNLMIVTLMMVNVNTNHTIATV